MSKANRQNQLADNAISAPSTELRDQAFEYLKHVAEVHKARMTWHLALAAGTVTLMGAGFQTGKAVLFSLAAAAPAFQFITDYTFKRFVTCPLVYKALLCDMACGDREPLTLLFLGFVHFERSEYAELIKIENGESRRERFRKIYLHRGLAIKAVVFGLLSAFEVGISIYYFKRIYAAK